ncbi:MAG: polyprenyl synthetase family protein, partial [Fimbriimonadaceae bacterium]|nr:polyprenyl synthetase family protein [Alphaproteobacteria bacterium]
IPEFIHNGSVIIDDIEDGSETRRGDETIHRRYGVPAAINAGNMLYFLPLLSLSDHPHLSARQRADIYDVIVKMFVQAHIGQAQDLFWSKPDLVRGTPFWQADDLDQLILQAHAFKTAASVRAISEVVCIIAQTDPALRDICSRFGESWGVAFQIVDDINNFTTRPEWGKVRGEDIAAGKASYVIHKAITMLEGVERSTLIDILENPKIRNSEPGLRRGIELVERSGALKACRAEAKALVETEWQTFSNVLPQSQSKILIRLFLTNLLDLPFEM